MDFELRKTEVITIRMNKPEFNQLNEICEHYNITYANFVRSSIRKYYEDFKEEQQKNSLK